MDQNEEQSIQGYKLDELKNEVYTLKNKIAGLESNVLLAKLIIIIVPLVILLVFGYEYTQIPMKVKNIINEKIGSETLEKITVSTKQIEKNRIQSEVIKDSIRNTLKFVLTEKEKLENGFNRIENKVDSLLLESSSNKTKNQKIDEILKIWKE